MKILSFSFLPLGLVVVLLLTSLKGQAEEDLHSYQCQVIKGKDKASSVLDRVDYNPRVDVGKNLKVNSYEMVLWHEEGKLKFMVRGGEFKKPKLVTNSLKGEKLEFLMGHDLKLNCALKEEKPKKKKTVNLREVKDLGAFEESLILIVKKPLKFRKVQTEENQMMRTLFFQNGSVYINSVDMEEKLPWCSLRVQLKERLDTLISPNEAFSPLSFQKLENGSYFTNYSYSFVDFAQGKKSGETDSYNPFLFTCNLLRGMPYTYENFKGVVGSFLDFTLGSSSSQTPQR